MNEKKVKKDKQPPVQSLNREHINMFRAIAASKIRMKMEQEATTDDVKALCDKLGWPAKKVTAVLNTFMKEEEKGGIIKESNEIIEAAEQILNLTSNLSNQSDEEN